MTVHSIPESSNHSTRALGSNLCLACGLCCRGVVTTYAYLMPNEVEKAKSLNLSVCRQDSRDAFDLPCEHHLDGQCSIYENRFKVCEAYQCELLKRLLAEAVSFDEALKIVRIIQELESDIYQFLGPPNQSKNIWDLFSEFFSAHQLKEANELIKSHPELLFKVRTLSLLSNKYFEPSINADSDQPIHSVKAEQF